MKSVKQLKVNTAGLKRLPKVWRSPQGLAVIASLGLHGVLFAAGPSFSSLQEGPISSNSFDEEERRVPMVELTAEEQGRLPNFDRSSFSLLPDDNADFLSMLPPPTSLGNAPLSGGLSSIPDIPFSRSPSTLSNRPRSPGRSGASPFSLGQGSSIIAIPNPGAAARPNRPNPSTPNTEAEDSDQSTEANGEGNTSPSNGAATTPEPSAADLALGRSSSEDRPDSQDAPPSNGSDGEASEPTRSETLIARVEYSAEQTTEAEAEAAQTAWAESIAEDLGESELAVAETFSLEIPYEQRICLNPAPSDGLLGLAVLPSEDDTATLSTTVLRSTGYPFLNDSAQQALQAQLAEAEVALEPGTLYQAVVKVNYDGDNCISHETLLKSRTEESELFGAEATESEAAESANPAANPAAGEPESAPLNPD